MKAST